MKILTVIGARPQFIKAAALSAKIAGMQTDGEDIKEVLLHTGQHYDKEMSDVFFNELNIPKEKYNLKVGSASHAVQTARMMPKIEKIIIKENPDFLLIYGDTNSTLAGALTAAKLKLKIAHVEAGMRSFNKNMPEEINRIVADHLADINFCSTETAVKNLQNEGLGKTAVKVGDIMFDTALLFAEHANKLEEKVFLEFRIQKKEFLLMTCHRAENTDNEENLRQIISAANKISQKIKIIFPVHPRTRKIIQNLKINISKNIHITSPLSYLTIITLEKNAFAILTDSGGMQKEAFFLGTPCITYRDQTEWLETVEAGMNIVTGANENKIISAFANFAKKKIKKISKFPYGKGNCAEKIIKTLIAKLKN